MRNPLALAVGVALLGFASQASAMTLNQAWQATKQNDPSYQSALLSVQSSELDVKGQKITFLPSLSASASQSWSKTLGKSQGETSLGTSSTTSSSSYSIGLSQTIWNSQQWDALSISQLQLLNSKLTRVESDNQLANSLFNAYMAVGQAKSNLALAEQQYQQGQELLSITQRQYAAGQIMSTSLTAMKANLLSEKTQILSSQSTLISAEMKLSTMIGQSHPAVIGLSISPLRTPPALPQTSLESWWTLAKDNSPSLLIAERQVKIAKWNLKSSHAAYYPTVSGSMSYSSSFDRGSVPNLGAGISVNIPLDLNGSIRLKVDQAQLAVEQAENQARSVALSLKQSVMNQVQQVSLDWQRVEMAKMNVAAQEEALHSQEVIYKAGMGNATDLINAHNSVFSSKNALLNLVYQYWNDRVALLASTGQLTDAKMAQLSKVLSL